MVSNAYKKKIKKPEIASKYKDRIVALLKCRKSDFSFGCK